jgi:dTDP-4-dehydrorhamnose 3,5-epimerase
MPTEPMRDRQTVTPEGESTQTLPSGACMRDISTHTDDRGSVFEIFDPRWGWHTEPMVFSYCFTIRPGKVKGWGVHREHEDRYCLLFGEMKVVLYDDRPDSSTCGLVTEVYLTEHHRQLLSIPIGVWHADENIGTKDLIVVNFPTIQYDHSNPDKYRLPLDTDQIPYSFGDRTGW